jgi:hypothetical protein
MEKFVNKKKYCILRSNQTIISEPQEFTDFINDLIMH